MSENTIPLANLPGENCYKLEVIEYYFDYRIKLFRITFKIVGVNDSCSIPVTRIEGGNNNNYKNIEIDLIIPPKQKYTGTLDKNAKYNYAEQ